MSIVIKPFFTPYGKYIYDRETNSILSVDSDEYETFNRIYENKAILSDLELLKIYQEKGYCKDSQLKKVEHPLDKMVEFHLNNKIEKITLQVTQNCNLRCAYCSYSGMYNQRTHSNKSMSYEIMEKSIDFIMHHSTNSKKIDIGFYGGEPLLEFNNIKKLLTYISRKYPYKEITYSMTSNGTVFTDDNIQFLSNNKFNILVSIDGPRELHNKNRVFVNGEGSFDKMMESIMYIKSEYPTFFKKISFNTVIAPGNDFKCANDFFNANDIIEENTLNATTISDFNNKNDIQYDDLYFITNRIQRTKLFLSALGLISKDKVSKLYSTDLPLLIRFYNGLGKTSNLTPIAHPGGPCIPGARRPMIDIDGNIYPCEKVSEESESMKIGNIYSGFDVDKVRSILNIGKLTENKCLDCWNFIHCGMCAASADDIKKLSGDKRLSKCDGAKNNTLYKFRAICLLKENNFDFEEASYYA